MNKIFVILILITSYNLSVFAYDTNMSPEVYRSYGRQQQKAKDNKGNTILITPHYDNYATGNKNISEKVVAIYDKKSPAYGYRYILYTPIGSYVGHHKIMQRSLNGYGFDGIPEGSDNCNENSPVPCFPSVNATKHYYYPQWY